MGWILWAIAGASAVHVGALAPFAGTTAASVALGAAIHAVPPPALVLAR